jgi:hypothetical protein
LSRAERVVVWLYAIALGALTSVPYLVASQKDGPRSRFSQTLVFERDFNSYCSYVRQSAEEGALLFRNQLTPERHAPAFLNIEFLAAGRLGALLGLSAGAALQALRAVEVVLFVPVLHRVCSFLLTTAAARWAALLALTTGAGFGWFTKLPLLGPLLREAPPVDLYAGLHPFFWMLLHPHFLTAQLCSVAALGFFLAGEAGVARRGHLLAGVALALGGLARPFDMLQFQCASVAYFGAMRWLRRDEPWQAALPRLWPALVPAPVLAYLFWLFRFHPIFEWWGRLNVLPPPTVGSLLLGIGLTLAATAAAVLGFRARPPAPAALFLACSALSGVVLVYSYPLLTFSFQFVTTLMVPLVLLCATSLEPWFAPRFGRSASFRAAAVAVLLVNASTSFVVYGEKLEQVRLGRFRIDGDSLAIFDWLREHSQPGDVVLAAERTSNRIARFTPASVVAGYKFSTIQYEEREAQLRRFYDGRTRDVSRLRMLKQYGVRYVVYGVEERDSGYDPASSPFLVEAFRKEGAAVFEVRWR